MPPAGAIPPCNQRKNKMLIEDLKASFPEILEVIGEKNRKGEWVCPFCDSGLKKNQTSAFALYERGKKGFFRFGCHV